MDAAKLEDLGTTHKGFTIRVIKGSSHKQYADLIRKKYAPEIKIDFATSSRVGAKVKNNVIGLQKVDLGFVDKIGFVLTKKLRWVNSTQRVLSREYFETSRYRKAIFDNLGANYLTLLK
jgi:hypothetical protein